MKDCEEQQIVATAWCTDGPSGPFQSVDSAPDCPRMSVLLCLVLLNNPLPHCSTFHTTITPGMLLSEGLARPLGSVLVIII